ncbi:uncharacterized protein TNIN_342971 [Trichonephila inaurata madagascariensis]|uniref:Gustatory receptor n=1 Tax=Trichonephila inaurata madagascariensis TaxID=2747483 RepID=A0A8X6YQH8_9ARAC|nr:uncharacterized protein TNIN_342971 [Trichonephila inaurata madagascariensis]
MLQRPKGRCLQDFDTYSLSPIENYRKQQIPFSQFIFRNSKVPTSYKTKNNAFNLLFKITAVLGIPIAPVRRKSNNLFINNALKIWCFCALIMKTFTRILSFSNIYKMLPGSASIFAFYFFNTFSYITTLTFIANSRKIYLAIKSVTDLSKSINPRTFVGSKSILYEVLLLIGSSLFSFCLLVIFFFYQEWNRYLKIINAPFAIDQLTYAWIVVFAIVFVHTWSYATNFASVLLCYNSFLAAGNLLKTYSKTILVLQSNDPHPIISSLRLFQEISLSVRNIDRAFSSNTFFLFGTLVGNFFASMSVMYSEYSSFHTLVTRFYGIFTLIGGITALLVLTISGNAVPAGLQQLREALLQCSGRMASGSPHVIRSFTLLSDSIRDSNLAITGCGMFTINKALMLTVGGMVITYSFLLFELSGQPIKK